MQSLKPFEYFEPSSIQEALQILSMYGNRAKLLAGGIDLLPRMRQRKIKPEYMISVHRMQGFEYIKSKPGGLKIGALTTLRSLELSPVIKRDYMVLYEAIQGIASTQVKTTGTAVGNLCVATPASDVAPPLSVLGAKLEATSSGSVRTIAIDNLCTGVGTTVLEPFEMVTEILVPVPPPQTGSAFLKLVRTAADIAKVNVAVTLTIENDSIKEAKIALGSVAPTLVRAIKAEAALIGNKFGKEVIEAAADAAAEEITPITDIRSTAEYRKRTTSVLVGRAIQKAAERAMASI